jgi:hypothetical protein
MMPTWFANHPELEHLAKERGLSDSAMVETLIRDHVSEWLNPGDAHE